MTELGYDWTVLWLNCVMTELCYDWTVLWLNCVMTELCCDWTVLWLNCVVTGLCCDWTVLWLNCVVTELCCDWTVLWLNCVQGGKRWVLRRAWSEVMDVQVLRESGREFQIKGAAKEKARLPRTDFTKGTCNKCWWEERRVSEGA